VLDPLQMLAAMHVRRRQVMEIMRKNIITLLLIGCLLLIGVSSSNAADVTVGEVWAMSSGEESAQVWTWKDVGDALSARMAGLDQSASDRVIALAADFHEGPVAGRVRELYMNAAMVLPVDMRIAMHDLPLDGTFNDSESPPAFAHGYASLSEVVEEADRVNARSSEFNAIGRSLLYTIGVTTPVEPRQ